MEGIIDVFRADVERTEAAKLRFITMRTADARAVLDAVEQTSRAQRTTEWESAAPVGREFGADPAAGQAGLATLTRYESNFHDGEQGMEVCATGDYYAVADVQALIGAAPVAATEQATDEQQNKSGHMPPFAAPASQHSAGFVGTIDAGEYDRETGMMRVTVKLPFAGLPDELRTINALAMIAPVGQSPAPVTAEPASINTLEFRTLLLESEVASSLIDDGAQAVERYDNARVALVAYIDSTKLAPADRDAIQALYSAVQAMMREALDCASVHPCDYHDDDVRAGTLTTEMQALYQALKSMERAADAAETRDAKGGD